MPTPLPRDELLALAGGRRVALRVAGAEAGPLVLYLHGSPSSRLDVDFMDERSRRRGVRLVGFDRPGYGESDFTPFTFATVAADAAAIADSLAAPSFAVVGFSVGVAHAMAVAALLPERVTAVATVGGGAPFEPGSPRFERLSEGERRGVMLVGVDDAEAERLLAEADKPIVDQLDLTDREITEAWSGMLGPADQRALAGGLGPSIPRSMREALKHGQAGWARDNVVWMAGWGFDLGAIRCPATIWNGEQDRGNVEGGKWLASRVSGADHRVVPGEGHLVGFELWDEVLDSLGL